MALGRLVLFNEGLSLMRSDFFPFYSICTRGAVNIATAV